MGLWNGFDISRYRDPQTGKISRDVAVLSLDFGHGQCSACYVSEGAMGPWIDLNFDNEQPLIPTAILYQDGKCMIGRQAAGRTGSILYFKDCPPRFSDELYGIEKKKLMEDFLEQLIRYIVDNNTGLLPDGYQTKLLLLVGCPSEWENWLSRKEEYAAMIENAAKRAVPDMQAVILPESRAAFVNVAKENALYLDKGILVLDFGSSTADYTWMQTGRKPLEGSWRLGASEIENLMLAVVLRDCGETAYDFGDLDDGQLEQYKWAMRNRKELYFNGEHIEDGNIYIYEQDEHGNRIKTVNKRTGRTAYKRKEEIIVSVDDAFMEKVIYEEQICLRGSARRDSWAGHSKEFIREVIGRMKSEGKECQAVILTGGASKMGFLVRFCEEEFTRAYGEGKVWIRRAPEPSYSVSRGLAAAALNDMAAEDERKSLAAAFTPAVEKRMQEFADNAADKISRKYRECALTVMEKWADDRLTPQGKRSRYSLSGMLDAAVERECGESFISRVIEDCFAASLEGLREDMQKAINERMARIYNNRLDSSSYRLNDACWQRIAEQCDVGKLCGIDPIEYYRWNIMEWALALVGMGGAMLMDWGGSRLNRWTGLTLPTDKAEKLEDSVFRRDMPESSRKKMLKKERQDYYGKARKKVRDKLAGDIAAGRKSGQLRFEEWALAELEKAFDVMAYYG